MRGDCRGHFLKKDFYLFIHKRKREREAETGRGRSRLHAWSPKQDLIPGLQEAGIEPLSHPGIPCRGHFYANRLKQWNAERARVTTWLNTDSPIS